MEAQSAAKLQLKATSKYKKCQQKTLSEVEKNYLDSLKALETITIRKKE
jgi:hypothetical protein